MSMKPRDKAYIALYVRTIFVLIFWIVVAVFVLRLVWPDRPWFISLLIGVGISYFTNRFVTRPGEKKIQEISYTEEN